jgi:methyl-accepting chemotaxis protein
MNMKIIVIVGNIILIAFSVVITLLGIGIVSQINEKMTVINDSNSVKQRYGINFRGSVHDRAISIRDVVLFDDTTRVDNAVKDIKQLESFYSDSAIKLDEMMGLGASTVEYDILEEIKEVERMTLPVVERIINLASSNDNEQAKVLLLTQASPLFTEWLAVINKF